MAHSIKEMIRQVFSSILSKNKALLLEEANKINDFMRLLMKYKNTGQVWTKKEKKLLRTHLLHLSFYIPALIIFCLPGGSLLFPLLAEILNRRKNRRGSAKQDPKGKSDNHRDTES
jgi:hypothetical protein